MRLFYFYDDLKASIADEDKNKYKNKNKEKTKTNTKGSTAPQSLLQVEIKSLIITS